MSCRGSGAGACRAALLGAAFIAFAAVSAAAYDLSPQALVRDASSRMLNAMQYHGEEIAQNPAVLDRLVSSIVLPYFDFTRMSQWVLGKYWRTATAEQREGFVTEFRTLLVRTYSRALFDYAGEKVIYLPAADETEGGNVTVRTVIELSDNSSVPIAYSLYPGADGWKIYDVAFSGVSLVTNYRSSFGRIIRTEGMDSLVRQMNQRNSVADSG